MVPIAVPLGHDAATSCEPQRKGKTMTNAVQKFQIGKTYSTRAACDWDTIYSWTVIARTTKTVTLKDRHGEISKRGVKADYDGTSEACYPDGKYSMCPVIKADRELS